MRHTIARNAADSGYTKKFVARNVAEVGRNSTDAILRAKILGVDTRCNSAIARNIVRNIAPCIPAFRSFGLFITVKTMTKLNMEQNDTFEIEILKFSRRGSRSPDNAEFGHFTLLFCRGWQRNAPRIFVHIDSHCLAH